MPDREEMYFKKKRGERRGNHSKDGEPALQKSWAKVKAPHPFRARSRYVSCAERAGQSVSLTPKGRLCVELCRRVVDADKEGTVPPLCNITITRTRDIKMI